MKMPEPMMFPVERDTGRQTEDQPAAQASWGSEVQDASVTKEACLNSGGAQAGDLEAWAVTEPLGSGQARSGITTGFSLSLAWGMAPCPAILHATGS